MSGLVRKILLHDLRIRRYVERETEELRDRDGENDSEC